MKIRAILAGLGLTALVAAAVLAVYGTTSQASVAAGYGPGQGVNVTTHVAPDSATAPTAEEADGLAYMRDEERLAHDVYSVLGAEYGSPVFTNISRSETQHTTTVKAFLVAFEFADPAAGRSAGSYADGELQALYPQLVGQGAQSLDDALRVGVAIEKRDIADLQARIAATDRTDLKAMYGDLLLASQNHLNAFSRQLDGSAGYGQGGGIGAGQGAAQGTCWN